MEKTYKELLDPNFISGLVAAASAKGRPRDGIIISPRIKRSLGRLYAEVQKHTDEYNKLATGIKDDIGELDKKANRYNYPDDITREIAIAQIEDLINLSVEITTPRVKLCPEVEEELSAADEVALESSGMIELSDLPED